MSYVDKLTEAEKAKYTVVDKSYIQKTSRQITYSGLIVTSNEPMQFTGEYELIQFTNCYFNQSFVVSNCEVKKIILDKCFIDGGIVINSVTSTLPLDINKISTKGRIDIYSCTLNGVNIEVSDAKEINLTGSVVNVCTLVGVPNVVVPKISVRHINGLVQLGYIGVEKLYVFGLESETRFVFDCLRVLDFEIDSIRNYQDFRIINIEALSGQSKFEIKDSYLGKAEFYDVGFDSFDTVTIVRTHLIDCSFIDVDWNFNMNAQYDDNNDEYSSRETFRQLKYALGKQGDTINEQKFHTLEMRAHYKSLDWGTDLWTKLIIKLSYITSNFGQSLWWPIRALFIGHLLFFLIAMLTGLSSVHISFANASWSAFNTAVYEYFNFINPLHKVEEGHENWTIIIDIFMRIWSSYMIYNIIRASRRFIK